MRIKALKKEIIHEDTTYKSTSFQYSQMDR